MKIEYTTNYYGGHDCYILLGDDDLLYDDDLTYEDIELLTALGYTMIFVPS